MIRIGAVVLNYNNWEATQSCISTLRLAELPPGYAPLFVVLVDSFSDSPPPDELIPQVDRFVELTHNGGYGVGNNRGLVECLSAQCNWVLVLNNDTEVEPDALARLAGAVRHLGDEDRLIVAPEIRYGRARDRIWYSGGDLDRRRGRVNHWGVGVPHADFVPPTEPASFISGCAMFASASTWRSLGGFDERYFLYWEDAELSVRHTDAGGRIEVVRDAVIYHDVGGGPRYRGPQRPDFYYFGSRNRLWLIRFGFHRGKRWPAMLWTLSFLVRTVGYLVVHDREMMGGKLIRIIAGTASGLVRRPSGPKHGLERGLERSVQGRRLA